MTPLEVLERVSRHLLAQGRKSRRTINDDGCAYRSDDGSRCAVGCLIADEAYDPRIEGFGVSGLSAYDGTWEPLGACYLPLAMALSASGVPATGEMHALLRDLQRVHDIMSPEAWPDALEDIRSRLGRSGAPA